MKKTMNKRPCENCKGIFDENDLDIHNSKWLCNDCEQSEITEETEND